MNGRAAKGLLNRLEILVFVVALGAPVSALAETIGTADTVRPDVSGGGVTMKSGDGVSQGEVIKSGPNGSTKIGFQDGTSLSIGSSAQVTLSHFVFADKKSFKKATFELGKGVFRFATGSSDKRAYEIKTPTSTISVRGTIFTVTVTEDSTTVDIENGSVEQSGNQGSSQSGGGGGGTSTTVAVESGSVSFCQGSNCQDVDAGQSATDRGSKNSNQNGQNNATPPAATPSRPSPPTTPTPYTPPNEDRCLTPNCSDHH